MEICNLREAKCWGRVGALLMAADELTLSSIVRKIATVALVFDMRLLYFTFGILNQIQRVYRGHIARLVAARVRAGIPRRLITTRLAPGLQSSLAPVHHDSIARQKAVVLICVETIRNFPLDVIHPHRNKGIAGHLHIACFFSSERCVFQRQLFLWSMRSRESPGFPAVRLCRLPHISRFSHKPAIQCPFWAVNTRPPSQKTFVSQFAIRMKVTKVRGHAGGGPPVLLTPCPLSSVHLLGWASLPFHVLNKISTQTEEEMAGSNGPGLTGLRLALPISLVGGACATDCVPVLDVVVQASQNGPNHHSSPSRSVSSFRSVPSPFILLSHPVFRHFSLILVNSERMLCGGILSMVDGGH